MWKIISVLMVLGLVGMTAAPAAAFHGLAYTLNGTALFKPTDQLWNMRLDWSGNGAYRVTLIDPVSGVGMPVVTMTGGEDVNQSCCLWMSAGRCLQGQLETLGYNANAPYKGWDSQTQGRMLTFAGIQENCLYGGVGADNRHIHVVGTFMQHWTFDVGMGTPFGTALEF